MNLTFDELKTKFPDAYLVRMRDLMSDSLQKINQLLTREHLEEVTASFNGFAVEHGLTVDSPRRSGSYAHGYDAQVPEPRNQCEDP